MTSAELAVLSLIVEKPRHGYEIEQVIQERGMREWTEVGFSSIYYLLRRMEQRGLIVGGLQQAERGPARKVYRPTPAGGRAFREAVLAALTDPQPTNSSLQLGLANLSAVTPEEAREALRQYRDQLADRLANVRQRRKNQRPLPYFVEAVFDHAITQIECEIEWLGDFVARMEELNVQD
jgi:DNA-binding PadR family transcriptional regulator